MMKKVKKGSAIVALLALVLSAMVIPRAYAAVEVNTEADCTLNFDLSDVVYDEVKTLPIDVDLYQIATMDVVGNYDAVDGFTLGTINDETKAEDWTKMAEDAMAVIEENEIAPTASSTVADGFNNLPVGLYLVVANDTKSDTYEYSFNPYLVSLPNNYYYTPDDAPAGIETPDQWVYDVTTSLKPERTDLYGDLVITKDLLSYNATVGGATFVFQVEAVKDYKMASNGEAELETVYSDVVSITFDAAGNKSVLIEDIPAGAEVTVTEVYSGGSYSAVDGTIFAETVIVADEVVEAGEEEMASVAFANEYDDRLNGGSGVVNHFEEGIIDEETGLKGWKWTSSPDSTN